MPDESEPNANGNVPNGDESEWVAVADLSRDWVVTEPRIHRAVKRKQFAPFVTERRRRTRTGMRMLKCVSIDVVPALKAFLLSEGELLGVRSGEARAATAEQKRQQSETFGPGDEPAREYIRLIMAQANKQIDTLEKSNEDLRIHRDELIQERERLRLELEEVKSLGAKQNRTETDPMGTHPETVQPVEPVTPSTPAPSTDALSDTHSPRWHRLMPSSPNEAQDGQKPGILGTIAAVWEAFTGRR